MDTWEQYPATWSRGDTISPVATDLIKRLGDPENDLFSDDDDEINVRITDITEGIANSKVYNDGDELCAAIHAEEVTSSTRIISVFSERTISPLQISSVLMRKILHNYHVHPDFLRVLFSFGEEPHLAEASSSHLTIHSPSHGEFYITYQVNYVEENQRKGKDPWSFRHVGIYHHHTKTSDLYIVLHPNQQAVLEDSLVDILKRRPSQLAASDPYRLHNLTLSSYFDNWRWYFRHLGDAFALENNQAMVVNPEKADAQESFLRVQSLRNMNDFTLFAKACCSSNLQIVKTLNQSSILPMGEFGVLETQERILCAYVASSIVLEGRIRNAIEMVGYTLTLHNQLETAKVDKELRDMTGELRDVTTRLKDLQQDSVDDSVTVKIITVVSAFYLPGSFVASIYGMNFFVFDSALRKISMGHDFWMFAATWLPLTFITGLIYFFTLWWVRYQKDKTSRAADQENKPEVELKSR